MDRNVIKGFILLLPAITVFSALSCIDEKPESLMNSTLIDQTIEHEYVDLGLSVYWATCNMGASDPYEHGGLYAWGELAAKKSYNGMSTYKWCNGSKYLLTKYNSYSDYGYGGYVDNKTVLDPEDDIATVMWGEGWRMPTIDEFNELINNCAWEWIRFDDVEGYIITSCVPGYTDRSIFMRASGGDWGGGARRTIHYAFYRSVDVDIHKPAATRSLYFDEETYGISDGGDRYIGFPVRPVKNTPRAEELKVELSRITLCMAEGAEDSLTAIVKQNYKVIPAGISFSSSNNGVATVNGSGVIHAVAPGTCIITAESGQAKAECRVHVTSAQVAPQMVDLGLSVKWATFNVGADSPEEVGYYLAWGETATKTTYSHYTYKFNSGTDHNTTVKYCDNSDWGIVDNINTLEPEDDAATVLWGDDWRMPTSAEMDELREKCTWTWTALNGVEGYRVTSKVSGYTNQSIFLPAAGVCRDNLQMGVGILGHYFTSSTSDGYRNAWKLYFDRYGTKPHGGTRYDGSPVRPVANNK